MRLPHHCLLLTDMPRALYFRAQNGTFRRVPQKGNVGFEGQKGGMTVYYMQNQLADYAQKSKVKAFQPVCRDLANSENEAIKADHNRASAC